MSRFPTTAWRLIDAVKHHGESGAFSAETNRFIAAYWKPVFRFLRSRGHKIEDAEDLTQSFFLRVFEKGWVDRADAERGRFRTFLLTLLKRFVSDQGPKRDPRQATFECQMVPVSALITDEDRQFEPPMNVTPEVLYMREWARATIAATCKRLQIWCEDQGRPDWYAVFELTRKQSQTLSERAAAETLGISRDQVRTAKEKTEEQFKRLLRSEVAGQLSNPQDIDDEIRELERLL